MAAFTSDAQTVLAEDVATMLAGEPSDYLLSDYHLKNGSTGRDLAEQVKSRSDGWGATKIIIHSHRPDAITPEDSSYFAEHGILVFSKIYTLNEKGLKDVLPLSSPKPDSAGLKS